MIHGLSVIFWYWYLNRTYAKHSLLMSTLMFGFGGVVMTVIYGAVNYKMGGPFLYFISQMPGQLGWPALSGYAYQASYWESFGHMLLYNKAFIVPFFSLLSSLVALFYFLKKKPEHPYRCAIVLCLVSFLLCWPIPILYQALGWPVLSLPHWLMGMNQFVFLAMAALVAVFTPALYDSQQPDNLLLMLLIFSWVMFCSALIFGSTLLTHLIVIACFFFLFIVGYGFKNGRATVPLSKVIIFFCLFLLSIAALIIENKKDYWNYWAIKTVLVSVFLLLPFIYLIIQSKIARKYGAIVVLTISFAIANVYAVSIPLALYDVRYPCGYLKDMYVVVTKGQDILTRFARQLDVLLWFRYNAFVPHPNPICDVCRMGHMYRKEGIPMGEAGVIGAVSAVMGAGGIASGLNYFEPTTDTGWLRKTLKELPQSDYWIQRAPVDTKNNMDKQIITHIPLMLLRTNTLSEFPQEEFWLRVFPNHYKWAVMDPDFNQIQAALNSFQKYGYHMADQKIYHLQSGPISYYLVTGYIEKNREFKLIGKENVS